MLVEGTIPGNKLDIWICNKRVGLGRVRDPPHPKIKVVVNPGPRCYSINSSIIETWNVANKITALTVWNEMM
jgi:hypothetical protein